MKIPFENDADGRRMAERYAGKDFDKPRIVRIEVLCEYDGEWTLEQFQSLLYTAIARIPQEYKSTTIVEMSNPGLGDSSTSLEIHYTGPESDETVNQRILMCEQYVAERRKSEREMYESLKAKFEGGAA